MYQISKGVRSLFYINVFTYLFFLISGIFFSDLIRPFCAWSLKSPNFFPGQFITYQFLHAGLLHLFFNMIVFISFGPPVEKFLGNTKKFYLYYLICGIVAAILHMSMVDSTLPLVGASGSIWGITAIFALNDPNAKMSFNIKAKWLIGSLFLTELLAGIISPTSQVSHWGHIGGALMGVLFYLYEKYLKKNNQ